MSHDSEIAEGFRAMKLERQTKRASMKAQNTAALTATGVPFTSHNEGAHLIVCGFDFWPSTGQWIERGLPSMKKARGFGLKGLLDAIERCGV